MKPIRQILEDAPIRFLIPLKLRYRRIELITWPLGEQATETKPAPDFKMAKVHRIDIPSGEGSRGTRSIGRRRNGGVGWRNRYAGQSASSRRFSIRSRRLS
jgi:hypothetical protein